MTDEVHIIRNFSPQEKRFIRHVRGITPKGFIDTVPSGPEQDIRILGISALALSDYNQFPPLEGFIFNSITPTLQPIIVLGTEFYIASFRQMEFSLIDVQYSDMGLSISLDRVGKIGASLDRFEKLWLRQLENAKKNVIFQVAAFAPGLGSPRFQSNLSKAMAMLGGGAYGWNIP